MLVVMAGAAVAISALLCLALIRLAPRLGLVSTPNARSSHVAPTPTGGGLAIIGASLAALPAIIGNPDLLAIWGLAAALGALGLWDDLREPPALLRLTLHAATAATLVVLLGPERIAAVLGPAAPWLTAVALVWWLNLFNFMDGIDALAAGQGIFMAAGGTLIAFLAYPGWAEEPSIQLLVALGGATLGFLALNLPPARLFMGDVGSYFLGFLIAALALVTVVEGRVAVQSWLILAAPFVADATVTLVTRMLRGEKWLTPHRTHAYQKLARAAGGHGWVTLGFAAVNLLFLLPLAVLAEAAPWFASGLVAFAYGPLVVAAQQLGAGRPD